MTSSIVKPHRDTDFYVLWSDNSDAPLCWGTRAELEEDWKRLHSHHGPWDPERIERADLRGTSALWPSTNDPAYGWDDKGFVYEQRGWLRRDRLAAVCARISAGEEDMDLLEPIDDDWPVRPRLSRDFDGGAVIAPNLALDGVTDDGPTIQAAVNAAEAAHLNDLVAAWHDGAGQGQELHEFLGMTWEEYGIWTTSQPPQPLPTAGGQP